tara:strand:+ start:782 stop:1096 length:315 start_codon:yes stop_codon:yes gene_type:complete
MVRRFRKDSRKRRAISAQNYLQTLLENSNSSEQLRKNASKQLWKISTRHGIGLPNSLKDRYCRKCKNLLFPGMNSTVRIRSKVRYLTCGECGEIKRKNLGVKNE